MNQSSQSSDNTFVSLESTTLPKQTAVRSDGNICKNLQVRSIQFNSFPEKVHSECEPIVNVHKDGDKLQSIEFICSCGKSKILTFDYDEE